MSFEIKYDAEGMPIKSVAPEFIAPELEPEIQQVQTDHTEPITQVLEEVEESPIVPQAKSPSPQESWKVLREKTERAEKRAAELEAALLAAQSNKSESPEEDLGFSLEEDALAEGKHLNKVQKKIQKLENQLKQYEQQVAMTTVETRLKSQYPDFDAVVSVENLSNLRAAYPELATTINATSDLYSKAVSAYTMIKKLGIAPQEDTFQQEKMQAQRNAVKPKSLASISPQQGDSPLSKANAFANGNLTEDLKKQLWKEMNEYRK